MKIIIVDDEPKICRGLQKMLGAQEGWTVAGVFEQAAAALEFLQSNRVDVMITDIRMPETSGLELIHHIRSTNQELHIVILSGYSNFAYAQKAIELGVTRYLVKPTSPRELLEVLRSIQASLPATPPEVEVGNLLVAKAMEYVERNYTKKITLGDMSEELFVSPNYLCELFKRHSGKNLMAYINEYRMVKAKTFLGQVEYNVSDVAQLVGYSEAKYFSSAFKKLFGISPLEYRNGKRNAGNS